MLLYNAYFFNFAFGNAISTSLLGIYIDGVTLYIFESSKIAMLLMFIDLIKLILACIVFIEKTDLYWIIWSILGGTFMVIFTLFGYVRGYASLSKNLKIVGGITNIVVWISFIVLYLGVRGILPIEVTAFALLVIVPSVFFVIARVFYSIAIKIKENSILSENLQHRNLLKISYFTISGFFLTAIPCVVLGAIASFGKIGIVFELAIIFVSYIKLVLSISNICIIINKILIYNILPNGKCILTVFKTQHLLG